MKVLIVGLGSMGKRRGRILRSVKPDAELCGVDLTESRRKEAEDLGIRAYDSISGALAAEHPDCAFVCTAPITLSLIHIYRRRIEPAEGAHRFHLFPHQLRYFGGRGFR